MIEILLFTFTFVATVSWVVGVMGALFGKSISMPIPLLYHLGVTFANYYISTPSMMYQVYFWGDYFGIFV
jgi:hypothetical protein